MSRATMGFDPGVGGGIAVLNSAGVPIFVEGFTRKMTEDEILHLVRAATISLLGAGGWECYAEKVGYIKGDGGKGSFTFGGAYRFVRAGLKMGGVKIYDVPPVLWQAKLECLTGGDKNVSKRRAIALFPGVKVTHAVADALLIALYGQITSASMGQLGAGPRPPL